MAHVYIQDRLDGSYAVMEEGKAQPAATAKTQEEAIVKAKELLTEPPPAPEAKAS